MSSTGLQLLVFDARRGNREGQEIQKILAFYPTETPEVEQITTAGLLHGLLLFSSNFCQDCWEVAETDRCTWVVHQAEPSIWLALAAPRAWVPRHCTQTNLRAVLLQSYQIISLLHGPIEGLLQQDGSGQQAERAILPVLEHLGRQLSNRASWQHRQLRNPLADVALAPMLRLSPATSLAVQNFSNGLHLVSLGRGGGSRGVEGVVLLYQLHVVWSSLAPEDTAAIYSLAATALLHPQSAGQRGTACEASQPNMLDSCCWHQLPSKYVVLRPGCLRSPRPQHLLPTSPSLPGQLSPSPSFPQPMSQQAQQQQQQDDEDDESQLDEVASIPVVQIQGGQEPCHLLPYKEGKLWVLLLVSASVHLTQHTLAALQAAMGPPAQQLAAQVGLEVRDMGAEPAHLPGYRYLFCDQASQSCVATPRVKISAMLHHSRALAASVRESLSLLEPSHRASGSAQGARNSGSVGDGWCIGEGGLATTEAGQQEGGSLLGDPPAWLPNTGVAPSSGRSLAGGQLEGMEGQPGTGHDSHAGAEPAAATAALSTPTGNGSAEPQGVPGSCDSPDSTGSSGAVPADEPEVPGADAEANVETVGEVEKQYSGDASAAASANAAVEGQPPLTTTSPPGMATGPEECGTSAAGGVTAAAPQPAASASALPGDPSPSTAGPITAAAAAGPLADAPDVVVAAPVDPSTGSSSSACSGGMATPPPAVGANEVHEVLVRSSQDCWAEARVASRWGRQLVVVRERKTEKALGEAAAVMDAFADSFMC